jgi:hypothetical protein
MRYRPLGESGLLVSVAELAEIDQIVPPPPGR